MSEDWWAAYSGTHMRLTLPDGTVRRLEQVPGVGGDEWPFDDEQAWIITAFNPRSVLLAPEENRARDEALGAQLRQEGLTALRNEGFDPEDSNWWEAGYTLPGADASIVMDIAAQWEQNAVFAWLPSEWRIVGVLLEGELVHGWKWQASGN